MKNELNIGQRRVKIRQSTFILLACIYSTQVATAAIINNLHIVTVDALGWTAFVYILSFWAAIPQAGFSDESGRKKHLLIASFCVLAAVTFLCMVIVTKMNTLALPSQILAAVTVLPPCFLLAATGNAIPIARGCLSVLKFHNFRVSIGLSTACIGLGWITVNLLSLKFSPAGVLLFSMILQLVIIALVKYFIYIEEVPQGQDKKGYSIVFKSFKWCASMLFVTGGGAALLAYLLTETSFYQLYASDELPTAFLGDKVNGVLMGIAYFCGVIAQWLINPSDRKSIKFGVTFSLLALLIFCLFDFYKVLIINEMTGGSVFLFIKGLLQFLFAFGFGFTIPSLFSLMSRNVHPDHTGRLFGAVDSTDTLAFACSDLLLNKFLKVRNGGIMLNSTMLVLFFFSLIWYYRFIKLFKSYEKN